MTGHMYVRRIHFIQTRTLGPQDFASPEAFRNIQPAVVATPSFMIVRAALAHLHG